MLAFDTQLEGVAPLFSGLLNGCAYGLLALGIVLLYKSDRILNFAQGEFAGVALITGFVFDQGYRFSLFGISISVPKVPYVIAIVLGVSAAVLCGVLTQLIVVRPLFRRPRVTLVVATIGVALLLIGAEGIVYPKTGSYLKQIDGAVHLGQAPRVDQIPLQWGDLLRLVVLAALAILALLFFRVTATGTAIIAVSQDPTAAEVVGIQTQKISLITWAMSGFLGGIAGVLPISSTPVQPGSFTGLYVVAGFVAAVLGGITSLPGAFAGGILLGLIASFANVLGENNSFLHSHISGVGDLAVLLVLLLVLLVRPSGLLGRGV